eukprot:m.343780 g.343780  ORF g.343780 m.343780 type:complete len:281 (+) comp16550_c0_seq87:4718-5560(+)
MRNLARSFALVVLGLARGPTAQHVNQQDVASKCPPCLHNTDGPCIAMPHQICFPYTDERLEVCQDKLRNCGSHSRDCLNCANDTAGPCITPVSSTPGLCFQYIPETQRCSVGTEACWPRSHDCSNCARGSSGPCYHPTTGVCFAAVPGTDGSDTCAHGLRQCWCDTCRFSSGPCINTTTNHCTSFVAVAGQPGLDCPVGYTNCLPPVASPPPTVVNSETHNSGDADHIGTSVAIYVTVAVVLAIGTGIGIFMWKQRANRRESYAAALRSPMYENSQFKQH